MESGTIRVRNRPGHLTKPRENRVLALTPEVSEMLRRLPRNGEFAVHAAGTTSSVLAPACSFR